MLAVNDINLFYGAAQALRGISLTAEPGKVTCVLGRNGVGKTSLLRALVGQGLQRIRNVRNGLALRERRNGQQHQQGEQ